MASFILLLGLCSLAVAKPVTGNTADVVADNVTTAQPPASTGYVGCYREGTDARALTRAALTHPRLTIGVCQDFCKGYRFCTFSTRQPALLFVASSPSNTVCFAGGLEYGNECFCGYRIHNGAYQVPDSSCTVPCVGDPSETCGGGNLLSVYKSNFTVQEPRVNYTAQGCYAEPQDSRALHRVLSSFKVCSRAPACFLLVAEQHG